LNRIDNNCGNCANVVRKWKMAYYGDIRCDVECTVNDSSVFVFCYRTNKFLGWYPNYQPFCILIDNREGYCQHHTRKEVNSKT
jgi:hypothetical protein